ncbi:MAG: MFS transporter [archaeon GB-1845-036]|nr:MFS transporter [Candidatus Culexmicrobium thermophilum]RLE56979.1 MAG: MFS transporter [Candidatus Verstraetearchaeota archaeon]HDO20896.1 MFS transporter [Candidatus Bathyarchaeota archaeon]
MEDADKILWSLHLATLCFFLGMMIISPLISPFSMSLGASPLIVGVLSSLTSAVAVILRPIFGLLGDRGLKFKMLMFGCLASSSAAIIYVASDRIWIFAAARIIHGIASAAFMPSSISTAIDLAPPGRIGEALGWRSTMFGVSQLLGPGIGGFLADLWGFNPTFLITFLLSSLSLIIVFHCSRKVNDEKIKNRGQSTSNLKSLHKILKANFLGAMIAVTFHSMGYSGIFTFLPALYKSLGFGAGIYGLYASIQGGVSIFTRAVSGRVADKHGSIPIASLGLILMLIGYISLNFLYLPPYFIIPAILFGAGVGLWVPAIQLFALATLPPEIRGFGSGIYSMAFDLGFLLGPIILGYFIEIYNNYSIMLKLLPFFVLAALITLQLVNLIIVKRRLK